jgi:hypothetical protein
MRHSIRTGLVWRLSSTRSSVTWPARGSWDGATLTADQVQLGQHDDGGDDD